MIFKSCNHKNIIIITNTHLTKKYLSKKHTQEFPQMLKVNIRCQWASSYLETCSFQEQGGIYTSIRKVLGCYPKKTANMKFYFQTKLKSININYFFQKNLKKHFKSTKNFYKISSKY